jgi:5'-3' exonuclease
MMGTDYNYGIKGMGKKRSVEAINKYGSVAKFVAVKYDITDEGVEKLMKEYKRFITYVTF